MLPILQRELADQRGWLTEEELMDYYAIGQCTPGIIALNVATFTGRKRGGDLGGVVATAGFILPSLCIIIALAGVITAWSISSGCKMRLRESGPVFACRSSTR